jgi:hypothetical protein
MFYNRLGALENLFQYVNAIALELPFFEIIDSTFLYKVGPINPSTGEPFYVATDYVIPTNWWAPGYNDNTKANFEVPVYSDLLAQSVPVGTIGKVTTNSFGFSEWYIFTSLSTWERIGLQYGTVQISDALWNYPAYNIGYDGNFFDSEPFDTYPSEETRWILRALAEQTTDSLLEARNKALILMFEYMQSETIEYQNYLPWLSKTSLIDVSHTVRELLPIETYQSDNQDFLSGYINEVKPYHVVIKDFLFVYTGSETYDMSNATDFDLPAIFNVNYGQFISPQMEYQTTQNIYQYLYNDPIWQTSSYSNWYQNYGLSLTGQPDYAISYLSYYVSNTSTNIYVDNIESFPVNGVIKIYDINDPTLFELISYGRVDIINGYLTDIIRAYNGTTMMDHITGQIVYIDLPGVILMNKGRTYSFVPKVTAYIDTTIYPAPTKPAILQAVMNLDTISYIEVIDPGSGYVVQPEIIIQPAEVIVVYPEFVNLVTNVITIAAPILTTGDLIQYVASNSSSSLLGLQNGSYYYVNVLVKGSSFVIALYNNYYDSIYDNHRVKLLSTGTGTGNQLLLTGRAVPITTSKPVREITTTLKFDRTSYNTKVIDWEPSLFYAGTQLTTLTRNSLNPISSSSVKLASDYGPPINKFKTSGGGQPFEILSKSQQLDIQYSTRYRFVSSVYGPSDLLYPNGIKLSPGTDGLAANGNLGPTTGFYKNMAVKFDFSTTVIDNIQSGKTYYVFEVIDTEHFSITDTIDGSVLTLISDPNPDNKTGKCFGSTDQQKTIINIDYPEILNVTATQSVTNYITVPLTVTGLGGTGKMYSGMPVIFTGNTFGNVRDNQLYYITTVVDNQHITISSLNNPIIVTVSGTSSIDNTIICDDTSNLNINDPIIFTSMVISQVKVTNFGNIIQGVTYYVSSIVSNTTFTISDSINGSKFVLSTVTGYCVGTDQKNTLPLVDATGLMSIQLNNPISPGQINGQLINFYKSGPQYPLLSGTNSNFIVKPITNTVASSNRVLLYFAEFGLQNLYNGLLFKINENVGGLTIGTVYYLIDFGITEVTITATSASTHYFTCSDTSVLTANMSIKFSGNTFGGVIYNHTYYVKQIIDSNNFTISQTLSGPDFVPNTETGTMTLVGSQYLQLSLTDGGPAVTLTDSANYAELTQYIDTVNDPVFDVTYLIGGYQVSIHTAGEKFAVNNVITINGTNVGGVAPNNNVIITVLEVDASGGLVSIQVGGNPVNTLQQYYLKAISNTACEVYYDNNLSVPVPYSKFDYMGIYETTVTGSSVLTQTLTITDYTNFTVNDLVYFTPGTSNISPDLVLGTGYYITSITPTVGTNAEIQVSTIITGTPITITVTTTGLNYVMSKYGDFAYLPQPYMFSPSVVKYNNKVYQCYISNNDATFELFKWFELTSDSRDLNALDRVKGFYKPDPNNQLAWTNYLNLPGLDITQLIQGTTWPYNIYSGNLFAPDEEFELDTLLQDLPFTTTQISSVGIINDGTNYIIASNTDTESILLTSIDQVSWTQQEIVNQAVNFTSLNYINGVYYITANDPITQVYYSNDSVTWTPTSITTSGIFALTNYNSLGISVGSGIFTYNNGNWTQTFTYYNPYSNILNGVQNVVASGFTGLIAVGKGQEVISGILTTIDLIATSTDGINWTGYDTLLTNSGFKSVTSDMSTTIVIVGENGVCYTTSDTVTYSISSTGVSYNLNCVIYADSMFISVGDNGTIITSSDAISWTVQTSSTNQNLNTIIYSDNMFTVVGDNNTILTSNDGVTWTVKSIYVPKETVYNVAGAEFQFGYGPEELVPGVVKDNLNMIITTRPGTVWNDQIYQHVGYNVVSIELQPLYSYQTVYSFHDLTETLSKNPVQIFVAVIDATTNVSQTLYVNIDYTVDWINWNVILNNPIQFTPKDTLRIDVYEVGNGNQLTKSSSHNDPIITDEVTGFIYAVLGCNYTAPLYAGSGVVTSEGEIYTEPYLSDNGNKLKLGRTYSISATDGTTNEVICNDTTGLSAGTPIIFSNTIFGNINSFVTYNILSVVNTTAFILEDPLNLGNPLVLATEQGGAIGISYDAAYSSAPDGKSAILLFARNTYDSTSDYLTYTVLGESQPEQYGYTVPETQIIMSADPLDGPYALVNYLGGDNPNNAIVELNGLRVSLSDYTIDYLTNTITFVPGIITMPDMVIAVTTYNRTERQYFLTNTYTADSTQVSYSISNINNVIKPPLAQTFVYGTSSATKYVTVESTSNFVVGQSIQFKVDTEPTIGNLQADGTVYWVYNIVSPTEVQISTTYPASSPFDPGTGTGIMFAIVGGQPAVRVTTSLPNTFVTNDKVVLDGINGSYQLNGNSYYIHVINSTQFDLYFTEYNPLIIANNTPVLDCDFYVSGGFALRESGIVLYDTTATATSSIDNSITVTSVINLIVGTEIIFTGPMFGNIAPNRVYYILSINYGDSKITISENYNGYEHPLTTDTGSMNLCQWVQTDVNRLWVTVNGYRIPSTSLRIFTGNHIAILSTINIGDQIIITSMVPSATPDQLIYLQIVDASGKQKVYAANNALTGWATQDFTTLDNTLYVDNVDKLLGGNLIYVNGEQIRFESYDLLTNSISNLTRGINGTPIQNIIPKYSRVYPLSDDYLLNQVYYDQTWNSDVYNPVQGDPLQISQTAPAIFLRNANY